MQNFFDTVSLNREKQETRISLNFTNKVCFINISHCCLLKYLQHKHTKCMLWQLYNDLFTWEWFIDFFLVLLFHYLPESTTQFLWRQFVTVSFSKPTLTHRFLWRAFWSTEEGSLTPTCCEIFKQDKCSLWYSNTILS